MLRRRKLRDVREHEKLWVLDGSGRALRNLKDLERALEEMPEKIFKHHVNVGGNDFADWVSNVLGDRKLGRAIRDANRMKMVELIRERLGKFEPILTSEEEIKIHRETVRKKKSRLPTEVLSWREKFRIKQIKEKGERAEALKYLLTSKLELKYHELEKRARLVDHNARRLISLELSRVPPKFKLLRAGFDQELVHINKILKNVERELRNV